MSNAVQENKPEHPETGPDVTIKVDGKNVTIHRGHQTVATIKDKSGVAAGYSLVEEEKDGRLVELPDDGAVTLQGGEIFHSHPKGGSSA